MEGGSAAAIEILVQNLINVLKEEFSLIRGLDEDAQQLQSTLETIQCYLNDAAKKYITQDAVKTWLRDLEKLAFDADNVLDELSYHSLHNKVKDIKTMKHKAISCFSSFDHTARPRRIAHIIKEINTSFDSINKRATDLHLQSMLVDAPAPVPDAALETDSFTDDPIFTGRDDDVLKLVEVMTGSPDKKFSILAVQGMGGMGKTTLTRKVFNHQKMKTRFGCQSWVHVSQTFDQLNIFKKFLASLPSQSDEPSSSRDAISLKHKKSFKAETETRQGILKKLQDALKATTYLLVLDDIWNEDLTKWTDFIDSLSGVTSTMGNGIIITTRNTKVASAVNPLETHRLKGLSDENCWSIIKARAFDMRNVFPSEFETIGTKIARRCQGSPLAAKVVGGVLRGKSEEEWLSVEQKWLSDYEGDYITRILRLSYDNLSSPSLKKCFSYCSIFPKGYRMVKEELIELWMAEGFLQRQPDGGNDMESLGNKFVNVLVCNSLLQVAPRYDYDDKDKEFYTMHDLVHDLATSVLGYFKVRYMRHDDESSHISKDSAKYLRTLILQGNILEFKLSDFKSLHCLTYGGNLPMLSSSIGKLIHLRRLDISQTRIEYLPDSIGELHHLQTLRANNWRLRELPRTLNNLISLRHLYIENNVKLPPEIGRLTSLRTLPYFRVSHENGCRIEELGSLTNLKGKLRILNLEKVQGKEEAEKAKIFKNLNLSQLTFQWDYGREGGINEENVLEGLQPHPNVRKLEIFGFKGKRFPLWTVKMAVRDEPQGSWICLKMLVEIKLLYCSECEEIPTLGHLPNLKRLHLEWLKNVKYIKSSFYGIENNRVCQDTMIVFPMLERLQLESMGNLVEVEFPETRPHEVKVFPRLQYLEISFCKLKSIPSHSSTCLKELSIWNLDELECLPEWLFRDNQNLSKLMIEDCPMLRELPDGLHTLNSLVKLTINDCPELKSIVSSIGSEGESQGTLLSLTELNIGGFSELECLPNWLFHNNQNLSKLTITDCPMLRELPHEVFDSLVASLETVCLYNLRSLKNLPEVIECLTKSNILRELRIKGVPKFMVGAAGSVKSWRFGSLWRLEIDASMEWSRENNVAIKETVDGMLQGCTHSLTFLDLKGVESWECVPESIQNLTSLEILVLSNFGIEELPEWFGNLSSPRNCKQLRRLGGSLTKLDGVYINDCPALEIDSLNNIPISIYVNGTRIRGKNNRCLQLPCV